MPAYVIVDITVRDRETYERYKQLATPAVAAYGGRYWVRSGPTETLGRVAAVAVREFWNWCFGLTLARPEPSGFFTPSWKPAVSRGGWPAPRVRG